MCYTEKLVFEMVLDRQNMNEVHFPDVNNHDSYSSPFDPSTIAFECPRGLSSTGLIFGDDSISRALQSSFVPPVLDLFCQMSRCAFSRIIFMCSPLVSIEHIYFSIFDKTLYNLRSYCDRKTIS